jgi:hypothetical protein
MKGWLLLIELTGRTFVPVDIYPHEKQCYLTLKQYQLGETVHQMSTPMISGGCVPCHKFPELCWREL